MELEGSLPYSQQPATLPCCEPRDQSKTEAVINVY